jgi:hypothetical protein
MKFPAGSPRRSGSRAPAILAAMSVVLAVALAGCAATKPTLRTDYDRTADFSAYRTYAYVQPLATDKAGYSTLTTQHFKNAIDAQLSARGYRRVDSDPDLLVNFSANATEKADVRSTPSATFGVGYYHYRYGLYTGFPLYREDVETVRYKVGTANVDVVDARRKQLVWEGVAEGRLTKEVMRNPEPAIRAVIADLFKDFPARAGAAQ